MSTTYIDFSAIKSGGGAQLALNFILGIKDNISFKIIISDKFPQKELIPEHLDVLIFRSGLFGRLIDEYITLKKFVKFGDVIYTFFGPGLPNIHGVKQVTGVAYPIICNYDSPYWSRHSKKITFPKRVKNHFRETRIKKASHLIFETEIMRSRFCATHKFPYAKTTVLPPTPTSFLEPTDTNICYEYTNFLFLTGLDSHKNLDLLISLANKLDTIIDELSSKPIFTISVEKSDFLNKFDVKENSSCLKYFDFVGQVPSTKIQALYDKVDVVCNISDLESFSNNYMEAWLARKPLLLHDSDFARYICGDSAVYANAYDTIELASKIKGFCNRDYCLEEIVLSGSEKLNKLPTLIERKEKILEIIGLS